MDKKINNKINSVTLLELTELDRKYNRKKGKNIQTKILKEKETIKISFIHIINLKWSYYSYKQVMSIHEYTPVLMKPKGKCQYLLHLMKKM